MGRDKRLHYLLQRHFINPYVELPNNNLNNRSLILFRSQGSPDRHNVHKLIPIPGIVWEVSSKGRAT